MPISRSARQGRKNATNIAKTYPINSNAVMYMNGPVSVPGSSPTYKAMAAQLTGDTGAKQVTINSIMKNNNGTFSLDTDSMHGQTATYATDGSTGRTTLSGKTGDYLYLYDTNSAVVLFADTGSGGGTQNLNWLAGAADDLRIVGCQRPRNQCRDVQPARRKL